VNKLNKEKPFSDDTFDEGQQPHYEQRSGKSAQYFGRYESQTTKSSELMFSALLGDDGTRNVRFERAFYT
jgi:hypothetical protein